MAGYRDERLGIAWIIGEPGGSVVAAGKDSGVDGIVKPSSRLEFPAAAGGDRLQSQPLLQPGVPPPPDYYRNNLLRVLEHVGDRHADLLSPEEAGFIARVRAASRDAQRLYARLVGRKAGEIRLDKLAYREIGDLDAAIHELAGADLVELGCDAPLERLLGLFTRDELTSLFERQAQTKKALLEDILLRCQRSAAVERLRGLSDWLSLTGRHCLYLVQLLFFGHPALGGTRGDLTTFVLEDLGMARFERVAVSPDRRLFRDRAELRRYLALSDLNALSHQVAEHPGLAGAVLAAMARFPVAGTRLEQRLSDRTLNRLGHWFERTGSVRDALECYGRSSSHPARERRVRMLARLGEEGAAQALLEEIAGDPRGPEEQDFAARFGKRGAGEAPPVTIVPLEEAGAQSIESRALDWFRASGAKGWHLENHLPLGLAGLAFWDAVFAPVDGVFLNPWQAAPLDLFWEDFALQRRELLTKAKARLRDPRQFARTLRATHDAKAGIVNRLVSWRHLDARRLSRILETVPHGVLYPLACHVIDNLRKARTGFPDLLVLHGPGDYEFVEVKGPNDRLQPAQRVWFRYFRENSCNHRILKFKITTPSSQDRSCGADGEP